MLGLPQEIRRAELAVHRFVGDHERLGGPREEVDADPAEELALGLRDEHVPGPDEHVDGRDGLGAKRHRADRLHPAEAVDLVRSAKVLGNHDGGIRLPLVGRRAGRDPLHPRDLRGHHAHVRGCDHRVLAARHVRADAVHRNVPMAEDDPRHRLVLDVAKGRLLDLGEVPDLGLRELDVGPLPGAYPLVAGVDGRPAQAKVGRRPAVEAYRVLANGRVATRLDVRQHFFHGPAHLRVRIRLGIVAQPGLEVTGHGSPPSAGQINSRS